MKLSELLEAYLRRLRLTSGKEATLLSVSTTMRALLAHFGPDFDVATMRAPDWLGYVEARSDLAPSSIRVQGYSLLAAIRAAVEDGELERVPCKFRFPPVERREPQTLTEEECTKLFRVAPRYLHGFIAAGLYLGLRIGESRTLRVGDVDLTKGEVRITPRAGWSPKSRRARTVPISKKARP